MSERIYEITKSGKMIPQEEIVRCKECKNRSWCHWKDYISNNGFCSAGDREDKREDPIGTSCENCEYWDDTEDGCADRHGCRIGKTCESCENFAGDGLYCAENHLAYDFSPTCLAYKPQTKRSE